MCNILILKPNQMLDKEDFWNMCHNNWHSWGLVVRKGDKLEITKSVPESGEYDPQEVWDAVEKNKKYQRYLHVRHITAGLNNLDNCHPLEVFRDGDKQTLFMHNGTLRDFKSKKTTTSTYGYVREEDDDSGPSDTRNFADQILIPLLKEVGDRDGDVSNPIFQSIIGRLWETNNRGLLISNVGEINHLLINKSEWKSISATDGESTILSANDLYFSEVTRGPEKVRRAEQVRLQQEEERKKQEAQAQAQKGEIVPLKMVPFREKHKFLQLTENLVSLIDSFDITTREGIATLAYLSDEEITELVDKEKTLVPWLISYVLTSFHDLYEDYEELADKKKIAEQYIAKLKKGAA